jgi:hypothetical protein
MVVRRPNHELPIVLAFYERKLSLYPQAPKASSQIVQLQRVEQEGAAIVLARATTLRLISRFRIISSIDAYFPS